MYKLIFGEEVTGVVSGRRFDSAREAWTAWQDYREAGRSVQSIRGPDGNPINVTELEAAAAEKDGGSENSRQGSA